MIAITDSPLVPAPVQAPVPDATDPRRVLERVRSLEASSARRAELTVLTAEGDRVTLVAEAETSVSYRDALLRRVGEGELLEGRGLALEQRESQGFSLLVEGELSREELRDLTRLAKKIKKVIRSFVQGDLEEALVRAGRVADRFGRLDSLAGFGLSVQTLDRVVLSGRLTASQADPSDPVPVGVDRPGAEPVPLAAFVLDAADPEDGEDRSDGDDDGEVRAIDADSDADSDGDDDEQTRPALRSHEGGAFGSLVDQIRRDLKNVEERHPRLAGATPRVLDRVLRELDRSLSGLHLSSFLEQLQRAVLDRRETDGPANSGTGTVQVESVTEDARRLSVHI